MNERMHIAGAEFDLMDWENSLDRVVLSIRQPAFAARVFFVNAHCVNIANVNYDYAAALHRAEFALNDGIGVELASRFLDQPLPCNLNGTDWIPALFDRLQATGERYRVYLLGARQSVVEAASTLLPLRWPCLNIVGSRNGYFSDQDALIADIERASPDILLVAMGVPKQELFIDRHWEILKNQRLRLALAGGAVLDFMTGTVPRAPAWMRHGRIEWLYRLWFEPKRMWKRYLWGNLRFIYLVGKQWLKSK